jgi:hypothetical protein
MKEIMCKETNFSASQIKKVEPFIIDYGFDGGYIYYQVCNRNITKLKSILGKSILKISSLLIVFLLFAASAWAGVYGRIEGGKDMNQENIYFTQIEIGYRLVWWQVTSETFGGIETWQEVNYPFSSIYSIGQRFFFRGFYTELNHSCDHRVISPRSNNSELHRKYNIGPRTITIFKIGYEFEIK